MAILVQNALHPKNKHRTEAISDKKYVEINTRAQADKFLENVLSVELENELRSVEKEVMDQFKSLETMQDVKMVLDAPDSFLGAAVMTTASLYMGKGDRTTFFNVVCNSDPTKILDLGRKLRLMTVSKIGGFPVYNDKLSNCDKVCKKTVYRLWLHCKRQHKCVTLPDLIRAFPDQKDNLEVWDKYVDEHGKTTLNMEDYMKFRAEMKVKAEAKKKQNKAKKGAKGKM